MKIACAVMCFDRPHYLKPVIESFEQADEAMNLDWFFFQDGIISEVSGHVYAEKENIDEVAELIRNTKLPVKHFNRLMYNVGPGQQRYRIYQLLDEYNLLFVFDDDMIVGRDYLKLLRIMAQQFPAYTGLMYTNEGGKPTTQNLGRVQEKAIARLWGHYMWKNNWLKFRKDHKIYYDFIKQYDFHQIRRLVRKKELSRPRNVASLSDDVVINRLCRHHGIKKLVPKISRGLYIGKEGIITYKTDNLWKKRGMERQNKTITYDSDKKLKRFVKKG